MMARGPDELLCDMTQYYGIWNYEALPAPVAAALAAGLPPEARIRRKLSGQDADLQELLLAAIADRLSILVWFQTKDGQKGRRRPKSLVDLLAGEEPRNSSGDVEAFASIEAFEAAMAKRQIEGKNDGEEKTELPPDPL